MKVLDALYNSTAVQAQNKGIIKFKGDYEAWKRRKRTLRRNDKQALYNASKSCVSHVPD